MDIENKLKIIVNYHDTLVERYHAIGTTIAQLTAAGCIDAKEHWRDGKYLYFLYPMKGGMRKKVYIGNHPLRVTEAQKKLHNQKDKMACIITQAKIQCDQQKIESTILGLLEFCSGFDLSARFACGEGYDSKESFSFWGGRSGSRKSGDKKLRRQLTRCTHSVTDERKQLCLF